MASALIIAGALALPTLCGASAARPSRGLRGTPFERTPQFKVYVAGKTPGFSAGELPYGIVGGPDGNVWFTEEGGPATGLAKITPSGHVTEYPTGTNQTSRPQAIVAGADGNLWFTDAVKAAIGRITPDGTVAYFTSGLSSGDVPAGLWRADDGTLWYVSSNTGPYVGRVDAQGNITEVAHLDPSLVADPSIAEDRKHHFWFTASDGVHEMLFAVTTDGRVKRHRVRLQPGANPCCVYESTQNFARARDGSLWFSNLFYGDKSGGHPVGWIVDHEVTLVPSPVGFLGSLTAGPDGKLWFAGQDPFYVAPTMGTINRRGQFRVFTMPHGLSPISITAGPDGNLWMSGQNGASGLLIRATPQAAEESAVSDRPRMFRRNEER